MAQINEPGVEAGASQRVGVGLGDEGNRSLALISLGLARVHESVSRIDNGAGICGRPDIAPATSYSHMSFGMRVTAV